MLIHISHQNITLEEKTFIPRVPKHRLVDENATIKRVCASDTIEHAISSFPYKNELIWELAKNKPVYLSVYPIDESNFQEGDIKTPEEIKSYVGDAVLTREHWILKSFTTKPYLVRLKELKFSRYHRHLNKYSGEVKHLVYEKDTEDYDRVETATFFHSNYFRMFRKACERSKIEIQEVVTYKDKMYYLDCIPSSRIYTVRRVTYKIPAGVTAKYIWNVILKEFTKNRRKCLFYSKNDFM